MLEQYLAFLGVDKEDRMKKYFNIFICVVSFLVFSFCSALVSTSFKDFQYDRFAFAINNYNKTTMYDNSFHPTIVNVIEKEKSKDNSNVFDKAFTYFYYNQANGAVRNQVVQDIKFGDMPIKLETQQSFTIKQSDKVNPGYYVDFGLYASYYLEEVLGNRGKFGNNCDSFVFISDTFADKLIELYGINSEDPYRTLIQEEEYYVLPLTTGSGDTIKFCINNILYSDSRSASRTYDLYGDFALFYYNGKVSPYLQLEFEIDLKDSPYSIKKTINDMEQLGYRTDNYLISFKQFDNKAGFYTMSEVLNNSYLSLQSKKTIDVLTGVGIFGIIIFSILFLYFFSRKRKISKSEKRIIFIIDLFFSVVFGVIVTFIYNYPWFSIGFLVQLIFTVILFRKELVNGEIFFNQRESI